MDPANNTQKMNEIRALWAKHHQDHVFKWVDQLDNTQRETFIDDLSQIDVAELNKIYTDAVLHEEENKDKKSEIKPFSNVTKASESSAEQKAKWQQAGYKLIAENKVAILLLAGGQASRLGSPVPKGMYDLGLPSGKSLYQLQVERAIRMQQLACRSTGKDSCTIAWYIMTSPATYQPTINYFRSNKFFGQPEGNFFFFNQHMQPCITPEGKVINESAGRIGLAPNGNGGLYKALQTSGALADMAKRGIEYVTQYCVDNVLIRPADPVFLGFMQAEGADCAAKVVAKAYPEEQVGVMAMINGKPGVVEYSEIDKDMRTATNDKGELIFNASHICINNFTRQFLQDVADKHQDKLRFHIARKKIPYANEEGHKTDATKENGWKMEMFIFDVFCCSKKMVAFEVARDEEFSPLKNGPGAPKDSPESVLADLCKLHTRYITKAGGKISGDSTMVEVSPLLSYAGEDLEKHVKDVTLTSPVEVK